jgi:hypothetical protein
VIGEIIETTSVDFLAESLTLHQPPRLGELVKVQVNSQDFCYAVVSFGSTSSPDAGRRAVRRSTDQVVDEAIYQANPQLNRLLQTTFRAVLVGWYDPTSIYQPLRQTLPPSPPPLHHAVHRCEANELTTFSDQLRYFRLILATVREVPGEQVLAAHIRLVAERRAHAERWLASAAREAASLLKGDHERLMTLLYAIDPES